MSIKTKWFCFVYIRKCKHYTHTYYVYKCKYRVFSTVIKESKINVGIWNNNEIVRHLS